jgi:phage terminase large subunit-like protein
LRSGARPKAKFQKRQPRPVTGSPRSVKDPRDYVSVAISFAEEALEDAAGRRHGKWVRAAAARFLRDLERAAKPGAPFGFSRGHAEHACGFIEQLPHVEGQWDSPTITLHPAHVFFVVNLFGFRSPDGKLRRFTTALLAIARKNAKSTLAAAILIYCLCCDEELGPQVISAATTGSQARIVFNIAKRMVQRTPELGEEFGLEPFANAISRFEVGGSFKPINSKASTQDGLNPSHAELDEIHAHKTHDLVNVLQSAAGGRSNPLWLYTTTEGYETPGPWPELRTFTQHVLQGVFEADHFFGVIFSLDDDDDEFDETKWVKANPLMDVNPYLLQEIRKAAIDAKQMPGRHAEFKIKRCNRQSATSKGWVRFEEWKRCARPVDLAKLAPYPCWGGLDLASTSDLCSFRLLWCVDGVYYTWGRRWVPEEAVEQRTKRGTVPYAAWVGSGALERTTGKVTDHEAVEKAILEAKAKFNLQAVAYDGWNAAQLAEKLKKSSVPMELFIQGPKSYHPAMKAFERAYVGGSFAHGGDPVLTWCAANLVVRHDANLNMAPDKSRSSDKIDDMTALLMAFGVAVKAPAGRSYQLLFV